MENNEVLLKDSMELQRVVQKMEKLEKMINPNSKKSLILWEEDDSFKAVINDIKEYTLNCDVVEFPIELLDKLKALYNDVTCQIKEGTEKIEILKKQAKVNMDLSQKLSEMYVTAMARNSLDEYESSMRTEELAPMREYLDNIINNVPESEEYIKAEKTIKAKISNLENSVHITIDLERSISKSGALEYIKAEIKPAVERLQTEYDTMFSKQEADDIIRALAMRRNWAERMLDAIVRPFASLFRKKNKTM